MQHKIAQLALLNTQHTKKWENLNPPEKRHSTDANSEVPQMLELLRDFKEATIQML